MLCAFLPALVRRRYLDLYPLGEESYLTTELLAITTLFVFTYLPRLHAPPRLVRLPALCASPPTVVRPSRRRYCLVFMRLSPKLGLLTSTLSIAALDLFWYTIFLMTIFMSYALAFHLAFGMDVGAFSSVGTSMYVT